MTSLRSVAHCIGITGDFSVVHDIFGLRSIPDQKELSVHQQVALLQLPHFHVNVILVGDDQFLPGELDIVNLGVFDARGIFAKAGLGVGRVLWFGISVSMADGHEDISSNDEAEELTNSWTVHNDGLDVFVVRDDWTDDGKPIQGASEANASCEKDAGKGMSGSVVSINTDYSGLLEGVLLAHEIAHDLGLQHTLEEKNLMFPKVFTSTAELHPWQVVVMLGHCLMQPAC